MSLCSSLLTGISYTRIMPIIYITIACVAFCGIYYMAVYNGLINKRNSVENAYSGIDIQLKKRWDLIPQLVETVKGYAAHETELFERVVNARKMAKQSSVSNDNRDRFHQEEIISSETPVILALAENYPELKADKQFLWLQRNLTEMEAQISATRRTFNACILRYNNAIQTFPSSIIASKYGFSRMDFFSINSDQRHNVSI